MGAYPLRGFGGIAGGGILIVVLLSHSVHPFMPLLVTSSGQRQFPWPGDSEGESASDGEEPAMSPREVRQDNALSLWWAGPLSPASEGNPETSTEAVETEAIGVQAADAL